MTLAKATRGYVALSGGGVAFGTFHYLCPGNATIEQNKSIFLVAIMTSQVASDQEITLSSDDIDIVSVPATVTVLSGQMIATFEATAGIKLGTARITALHAGTEKYCDVTVIEKLLVKPLVTAVKDLKPKIYDTEET